jgi:hypothetical protein
MKEEITKLLDSGIIKHIENGMEPAEGSIIRRVNETKDQQGQFTGFDGGGGFIIINVVDMINSAFLAEAGIIKATKEDTLFCYTTTFTKSAKKSAAREVLTTWPLYVKNPDLRFPMEQFFTSSFSPEHILYMKKNNMLDMVFIPLQQKLKIGRYKETVNWDTLRKEKFQARLKELKHGEHMTYIAMIPQTPSYSPKFYSIGTKPHEETQIALRTEGFNFKPTHGGHIKAEQKEENLVYYVDAGSNFLGKGVKTKLETAEAIVKALRKEHRDFVFIPLEGRGAFGTEQSY